MIRQLTIDDLPAASDMVELKPRTSGTAPIKKSEFVNNFKNYFLGEWPTHAFGYFENDIDDMATLVHELSHVCMYTFERIGMPHNGDTDEAYGYLIGFLTKKFFENVR